MFTLSVAQLMTQMKQDLINVNNIFSFLSTLSLPNIHLTDLHIKKASVFVCFFFSPSTVCFYPYQDILMAVS